MLWGMHLPAFDAFLEIGTQWRTVGGGFGRPYWIGLDYAAARAGLQLAGCNVSPETWNDLRQIEAGARDELNNR